MVEEAMTHPSFISSVTRGVNGANGCGEGCGGNYRAGGGGTGSGSGPH